MNMIEAGMSWVDLNFLNRPHAIATAAMRGAGSVALVDPGPSTCLEALELGLQSQGIRLADVTQLLLTHIHLDHAGATGTLLRRYPQMEVLVHERGAPHIVDPTKLVASAARLYGEAMERLWGVIEPVPEDRVRVLSGEEQIEAGGRTFEVAYTPGHASHHVSYFDRSSGVAFVGDTAGVCIDGGYVLPPTPPPDIDVELWHESVTRLESWDPRTIFITHFGAVHNPRPHLRMLLDNLETMSAIVRTRLSEPGSDDEKASRFAEEMTREFRRTMNERQVAAYLAAAPPELLWSGLARYWKKKASPRASA